jgi:antitoxin (DNA-binding transcriptional repressor) of toxin-antitoxin stability system
MPAQRVGIREFREQLSRYLEMPGPLAITRHGETVAYLVPTRPRRNDSELAALRAAVAALHEQLAAAGVSEEDILHDLAEFDRQRKAGAAHARA